MIGHSTGLDSRGSGATSELTGFGRLYYTPLVARTISGRILGSALTDTEDHEPPFAPWLREYKMVVKDRVAIITGASGGLGTVVARQFAERGAQLALLDRSLDRLEGLRNWD